MVASASISGNPSTEALQLYFPAVDVSTVRVKFAVLPTTCTKEKHFQTNSYYIGSVNSATGTEDKTAEAPTSFLYLGNGPREALRPIKRRLMISALDPLTRWLQCSRAPEKLPVPVHVY